MSLPGVLFLLLVLALLPAGGRCQQGGGDIGALPPSPTVSQEALFARILTVGSELTGEVQSKYGFCISDVDSEFSQTFGFRSNDTFVSDCMEQSQGQMVSMLCNKAEMELYLSSLGSKRVGRISRNCNQSSWATGCQSGWACSTLDADANSLDKSVPSRAENCRPCCPGFFCPLGLTCMMPCPLGAYCPLGTINDTTNLCDPYSYQITPGSNSTCGSADSWADVITTNDVFCPPGKHCPSTVQKLNCTKGSYCRKGSTDENKCFWKSSCKENSPKENITLFGGILIVILSVVLLLGYNCSDQFIAIRAKVSAKSRKKAAEIARESATARDRWKLAKELVLRNEVEMYETSETPEQLATSSDGILHANKG